MLLRLIGRLLVPTKKPPPAGPELQRIDANSVGPDQWPVTLLYIPLRYHCGISAVSPRGIPAVSIKMDAPKPSSTNHRGAVRIAERLRWRGARTLPQETSFREGEKKHELETYSRLGRGRPRRRGRKARLIQDGGIGLPPILDSAADAPRLPIPATGWAAGCIRPTAFLVAGTSAPAPSIPAVAPAISRPVGRSCRPASTTACLRRAITSGGLASAGVGRFIDPGFGKPPLLGFIPVDPGFGIPETPPPVVGGGPVKTRRRWWPVGADRSRLRHAGTLPRR